MPSSKPKKTSGPDSAQFIFALIAIGVAMAILASPIANAITSARRAAASVNLNEIAKAYDTNVQANTATHMLSVPPGATAHAAAFTLARSPATQLNDAIIWFVKSDPKLNGDSVPTTVTSVGLNSNSSSISPDFADKTLSYDIAANINLSPPAPIPQPIPGRTPIAWTRGLRDDGTWGPDSPWSGAGGHIAFLDGHVTWFDKLSIQPGVELLYKYGTDTPTTNINEALPPGTIILHGEPGPAGR